MYNRKDSYYKKAKQEGYKSRAAYKLKEINDKFRLINKGDKILDAGAAPGGWSQIALEIIGVSGIVTAVDLLPISGIIKNNFHFIQGDIRETSTVDNIKNISEIYDTVISDAAPNTTGQKFADQANSLSLVSDIFTLAKDVLKNEGNFIFKLFDGEDRETFVKELKNFFSEVKIVRPDSTRKNSFEIYVICKRFNRGE